MIDIFEREFGTECVTITGDTPPHLRKGIVDKFQTTPSFWTFNINAKKHIGDHFSIYAGIDNIGDSYQTNLDKWQYEIYNWGPLRGRYYYAGLSWQN